MEIYLPLKVIYNEIVNQVFFNYPIQKGTQLILI